MLNTLFTQAAKAMEEPRQIHVAAQSTTTFLFAAGDLMLSPGCCCGRPPIAQDKSGSRPKAAAGGSCEAAQKDVSRSTTGKIAAARWFAGNVLPHLSATRAVVEATDLSLMDLPDEAFWPS